MKFNHKVIHYCVGTAKGKKTWVFMVQFKINSYQITHCWPLCIIIRLIIEIWHQHFFAGIRQDVDRWYLTTVDWWRAWKFEPLIGQFSLIIKSHWMQFETTRTICVLQQGCFQDIAYKLVGCLLNNILVIN